MKFFALVACSVLSVCAASAASTDFADISYTGTNLVWGGSCITGCSSSVGFSFVNVNNLPPYDGKLNATLTYNWAPIGVATDVLSTEEATIYTEPVAGYFVFSYTPAGGSPVNLLTVDFDSPSAHGVLTYVDLTGIPGNQGTHPSLTLTVNSSPTPGMPSALTSDVLGFPSSLTDWSFVINFGSQNPGLSTEGEGGQYINGFSNSTWSGFTFQSSPSPAGNNYNQVPEPASMLMAGAGLLSLGGLLNLRKRLHK